MQIKFYDRMLCLRAAARRLQIPERTLRYRASHGHIQGALKQGKLWKFSLAALEGTQRNQPAVRRTFTAALLVSLMLHATIAAAPTARLGEPAPGFTLTGSSGLPIKLSDYQGKVVLLNFWATWCHGCQLEIPWFEEFQDRYKSRSFAVIGVSMDDDGWKSVKPYLEQKHLNYPVVIGNADLAKQYGLASMPMTILIDRQGKIAGLYTGVVDKAVCESDIRKLLPR